MSKITKSTTSKNTRTRREWPVVVYVWIIGLGLLSYLFVGEVVLGGQPHPWHWVAAVAGAIVGYFVGWQWYRWRGDII